MSAKRGKRYQDVIRLLCFRDSLRKGYWGFRRLVVVDDDHFSRSEEFNHYDYTVIDHEGKRRVEVRWGNGWAKPCRRNVKERSQVFQDEPFTRPTTELCLHGPVEHGRWTREEVDGLESTLGPRQLASWRERYQVLRNRGLIVSYREDDTGLQ
ncbi:unnamed protein product [Sympodiomycopsis kandeliae]